MKTSASIWLAMGLMATVLVSGCGSRDDDDAVVIAPSTPTMVPDSAGASDSAFITYLMTLNPNDETSEPMTLGNGFSVPAVEDSEPQSLI